MVGPKPAEQATYAAAIYADDDDDAAGDDYNDTFETETSTLTEVIIHTPHHFSMELKRRPTAIAIDVHACSCRCAYRVVGAASCHRSRRS